MAKARSSMAGYSPLKLRRVIDLVRGKRVDAAVDALRYMPGQMPLAVRKTIQSAAANAENNDLMDRANLKVVSITADPGPRLRRFRPKARGRVGAFDRPTSHLTVEVDEG